MATKKIILMGCYQSEEFLTGPEKVAKRLFDELIKQKYDVTFIEYFFDGRKYNYFDKFFGKKVCVSEQGGTIYRSGLFRIISFLLKTKPDIIHILTFERFTILSYLLKPILGFKIIYTFHGVVIHEHKNFNNNIGLMLYYKDMISEFIFIHFSDILCMLSEETIMIAKKYYKLDDKKIRVVSNGIDDIFTKALRKKVYSNNDELKIVFVGGTSRPEKGLKLFIDNILDLNIKLKIFVISKENNFNTDILPPNIKMTKQDLLSTEDLALFYNDKDVFLSASIYEPFSLAVVEAMAAGLIPVVSANTGMSRYIRQGINGFTFKCGEKEELNKILTQILGDDKLQERLSQEAAKIYEKLSWGKILEMYKEIYNLS
jgi:glycosyltransferase involved in cell wall biosynthesis